MNDVVILIIVIGFLILVSASVFIPMIVFQKNDTSSSNFPITNDVCQTDTECSFGNVCLTARLYYSSNAWYNSVIEGTGASILDAIDSNGQTIILLNNNNIAVVTNSSTYLISTNLQMNMIASFGNTLYGVNDGNLYSLSIPTSSLTSNNNGTWKIVNSAPSNIIRMNSSTDDETLYILTPTQGYKYVDTFSNPTIISAQNRVYGDNDTSYLVIGSDGTTTTYIGNQVTTIPEKYSSAVLTNNDLVNGINEQQHERFSTIVKTAQGPALINRRICVPPNYNTPKLQIDL